MHERIARYDFGDECLHTVAILGDGCHQMIHHDFIVTFELPAQRIGQQFLRQVARQLALVCGDDGFQFLGRREVFASRKFARGVDFPSRIVLVPPASDGIEVLQTKADGIENFMAIDTNGIGSVQFCALPHGQIRDRLLVLLFQGRNVRRGRRPAIGGPGK